MAGLALLSAMGAVDLALWFPGSGKLVARTNDWMKFYYRKHLLPALEKLQGKCPPDIVITREQDQNGQAVFSFDQIQIIDFEELQAKILEAAQDAKAEHLQPSRGQDEVDLVAPTLELETSPLNQLLYRVELRVPQDAFMGEIDFGNWEILRKKRFDFIVQKHTNIKDAQGREILVPVKEHDVEYQQVFATLRYVPLTLGQHRVKLKPNQKVQEVTAESSTKSWGFWGIGSLVDRIRTMIDGKLRNATTDPISGQNPHLTEQSFIDGLADLVVKLEESESQDILKKYYDIVDQGIIEDLKFTEAEIKRREKDLQAIKRTFFRKLVIAVVIVGAFVTLAIAGLVLFWPAGLAASSIWGSIWSLSGLGLQLTLLSGKFIWAGISALGVFFSGLIKCSIEFKWEEVAIAKRELKKDQEDLMMLRELHDEIAAKKEGLASLLSTMNRLGSEPTSVDDKLLDFSGKRISGLGVSIIRQSFNELLVKKPSSPWKNLTLKLSNCGLSTFDINELSKVLDQTAIFLHLRELDLTGNPMEVDPKTQKVTSVTEGVFQALRRALERNVTLTDLKYDAEVNGVKQFSEVEQQKIVKQLVVNRYLQKSAFGSTFDGLLQGLTPIQQQQARLVFAEGIEQVGASALEKIRLFYGIGTGDLEVNSDLDMNVVLLQNDYFNNIKTCLAAGVQKGELVKNLVIAYNLGSERSDTFLTDGTKSGAKAGIQEFFDAIVDQDNILLFLLLKPSALRRLLQTFSGNLREGNAAYGRVQEKIEFFPKILVIWQFIEEYRLACHIETFNGYPEDIQQLIHSLSENLKGLRDNNQSKDEFLEVIKSTAAQWTPVGEKSEQLKKVITLHLSVLNTGFERDSYKLGIVRLQGFAGCHPETLAGKKQTLTEFLDIYKNMGVEHLEECFKKMDHAGLLDLMRSDIKVTGEILSGANLDSPHLLALLEFTFKGESKVKEKAALVANFIGENEALYAAYLQKALVPQGYLDKRTYNYEELRRQLDGELAALLQKMKDEPQQSLSASLEQIKRYELILHPEFAGDYDSLAAKKYRIKKLVEVYPSITGVLEEFIRLGNTTDLADIAIDQKKLKKFIVKGENGVFKLRDLEEGKRRVLLAICFQGEVEVEQKVALVNRMIEAQSDSSELEEILQEVFIARVSEEAADTYSYEELKNRLANKIRKILIEGKEDAREAVKTLDQVLQATLQQELVHKFTPFDASKLSELKEALESNYELRRFEDLPDMSPEAASYMKFIVNRNQLYTLINQYQNRRKLQPEELVKFFELYSNFKNADECKSVLQKIAPLELLNIIAPDVGSHGRNILSGGKEQVLTFSCERLRELQAKNPEAFLEMFKHIFTIDQAPEVKASAKANLINELLKLQPLFENPSDPLAKAVTDAMYWSMVPWGNGISYNLDQLKRSLERALEKEYDHSHLDLEVKEALKGLWQKPEEKMAAVVIARQGLRYHE